MAEASDASTGELVSRLSHEVSELVRSELLLARAEVPTAAVAGAEQDLQTIRKGHDR